MDVLRRIVDGASCARRACTAPSRTITADDPCVRVSTPKGAKRLTKAGKQTSIVIWDDSVHATLFHESCWAAVEEDRLVASVADGRESFEAVPSLLAKAKTVAALIKGSKKTVAFTGAGISVAAGIPDYRGIAGVDVVRSQTPIWVVEFLRAFPT